MLGFAAAARAHQLRPWMATRPAPPLSLTDLDGKTWDLSALQGRAVLLNFWATWCEPCREEMPSLQALAARHRRRPDGRADDQLPGIRTRNPALPRARTIGLPVLLDRDGSATKAWTPRVFPTTVMIDRSGQPRHQIVGAVDWNGDEARRWVHDLLTSGATRS